MDGAPLTVDPHFHNDAITWSVLASFYEGLVRFSDDMRLEPALASSWEHPTATTWRFTLREGARFADGSPATKPAEWDRWRGLSVDTLVWRIATEAKKARQESEEKLKGAPPHRGGRGRVRPAHLITPLSPWPVPRRCLVSGRLAVCAKVVRKVWRSVGG
jgi:hypothetical protein